MITGAVIYGALVRIRNNNPVPIHLYRADLSWEKIPASRYVWAMQFNFSAWTILDDFVPDSEWVPAVPVEMAGGGLGDYVGLFKPVAEPLQGVTIGGSGI